MSKSFRVLRQLAKVGLLLVVPACILTLSKFPVHGQQAPAAGAAPAVPGAGQTGRGGIGGPGRGGGFRRPAPADWNNHDGWVSLFDGKSLDNWKGNKAVWSVEDGAIVGTASAANPVGTTYLIWTGGQPANFTLKIDFKLAGTAPNTGIQFRSYIRPPGYPGRGGAGFGGFPTVECSDADAIAALNPPAAAAPGSSNSGPGGAPPPGAGAGGRGGAAGAGGRGGPGGRQISPEMTQANAPYWMSGPQADFDPNNTFSGNFYDQDSPRGEMTFRGQVVQSEMCKQPEEIATLGDSAELAKFINPLGEWNRYLIVARDHVIMEAINDHVMSLTYDDDPTKFRPSGLIGLQLEGNGKIYFKNLYLKYH